MEGHVSLATILITSFILVQFSGALAFEEGKDSKQELAGSLMVMSAQDPTGDVSSAEEYINRINAEPAEVAINLSNPRESRALWLQDNNEKLNYSAYLYLMEFVRTQYKEDLNYSSYILDEFVKNEIDARDAMTSTMTLFTLTTETVDMVDQITPPDEFMDYHNSTLLALINLEGYLWNMVKFYETNRRAYAMQAHDNFNMSLSYYMEGSKTDTLSAP
ncbi:MAG: hypothetical protein ACYDHX_15520 [Methanothrix sp.]